MIDAPIDAKRYVAGLKEDERRRAAGDFNLLISSPGWQSLAAWLEVRAKMDEGCVSRHVREVRSGDGVLLKSREQIIDDNNHFAATADALRYVAAFVDEVCRLVKGR